MVFNKCRLGEITEIFSGFAFKSMELSTTGIPVIKIANIQNKRVLKDCSDHLPKSSFNEKLERYLLQKNDCLVAMTGAGSVGKIGKMFGLDRAYLVNQRVGIIRPKKKKCCPEYIYQVLSLDYYEQQMYGLGLGAGQPNISAREIGSLEIILPSYEIQCKVAAILFDYDDLIENNTRRIQILVEMTQRIYREWFVNFRLPGYEKVKFVDSELGNMPEEWKVVSLGDICYVEKNKYRDQEHSTLPLLDLARIPRKSLVINSLGSSCELKTSRIIFGKDNVLFGSIRPYFHKVFYAFNNGVTNTSVFVIKEVEQIPVSFLFSLLFSEETVNWANQNSGGTKMPVISWDVFKTMKVILPNKTSLNKFDAIASIILQEICMLNLKNLKLKATRYLLLPKLISGEFDVSELDITIRENKGKREN